MSNIIELLDQNTIDKIAAGEVVERPASIVKELVENAIDAGATAVTVEITEGGKKLIRITDNGMGIEEEYIRTAFLRHATSKIRKVEDLTHISSLGFRGEALSSIAAVSKVELITKTMSALSGCKYIIEGGKELSLEEVGAPDGTTFLVRNLFYNIPARAKFLKSDMTEANYINTLMEQLSMSHPEIAFKYIQDKKLKLHTSGNHNPKDALYSIYGREISRSLLEVSCQNDFMEIQGFIGKPEISRGNRSFENYYINGRYVKNNIITRAIEEGYNGHLMQHKFPFVSLRIEMDGNDLDVNVHPSKLEVRFARGTEVYESIVAMIRDALEQKELIPNVSFGKEPSYKKPAETIKPTQIPEPFQRAAIKNTDPPVSWERPKSPVLPKTEPVSFERTQSRPRNEGTSEYQWQPPFPASGVQESPVYKTEMTEKPEKTEGSESPAVQTEERNETVEGCIEQKQENSRSFEQQTLFDDRLLSKEARKYHRLIGQIFDTYWLVQYEDKFYIIDQHAAHEKVYYERFVKEFHEHTITSQYLSPPILVTLNLKEEETLKSHMQYFREFGFEIDHFGGKEYAISAVPSDLYHMTEKELFLELLDGLGEDGNRKMTENLSYRLATMACKAAVKGNHKLSMQEANILIDELLSLENPYHCPHGRPTIISMTRTELEKKFKRII